MLNIAQVVMVFLDLNFFSWCKWFSIKDYILLICIYSAYVLFTNIYVQIIGVLLATLWTAHCKWSDSQIDRVGRNQISSISFRVDQSRDSRGEVGKRTESAETAELDSL